MRKKLSVGRINGNDLCSNNDTLVWLTRCQGTTVDFGGGEAEKSVPMLIQTESGLLSL